RSRRRQCGSDDVRRISARDELCLDGPIGEMRGHFSGRYPDEMDLRQQSRLRENDLGGDSCTAARQSNVDSLSSQVAEAMEIHFWSDDEMLSDHPRHR